MRKIATLMVMAAAVLAVGCVKVDGSKMMVSIVCFHICRNTLMV